MFLWRSLTPAAIASAAAALTRAQATGAAPITPVVAVTPAAKSKQASSRDGIAKN